MRLERGLTGATFSLLEPGDMQGKKSAGVASALCLGLTSLQGG